MYCNFFFLIFLKDLQHQIIVDQTISRSRKKCIVEISSLFFMFLFLITFNFFIASTDMPIRVECRCRACDVVTLYRGDKYGILCETVILKSLLPFVSFIWLKIFIRKWLDDLCGRTFFLIKKLISYVIDFK